MTRRENQPIGELAPPPVPYEVDLKAYPYMPLEIARLRKSKAWLICKRRPELSFYMVNLWTAAWHERPAGSLEDDDDVLADFAMCPPDKWPAVREDVMRHWVKHADGRLYHHVLVEKVLATWKSRLDTLYERECGRIRREASRKKLNKPVFPTFEQWNAERLSQGPSALSVGHTGIVQQTSQTVPETSDECPTKNRCNREITDNRYNRESESEKNTRGQQSSPRATRAAEEKQIQGPHLNGHTVEFEAIKQAMPRRLGTHRWNEAATEYLARRIEGHSHEDILAGVVRYAAHVRSAGKENTQFVQQAKTLLGPSLEFLNDWPIVRTAAETKQDDNVAAAQAWLDSAEEDDDAKH